MKKSLFFIALIIASVTIQAQNYLINFAANGSATSLDSIKIENLTQSTTLTIQGTDVLHLVGQTGIFENNSNVEILSINPNPMDDQANLSFNAKESGNALFSVFDMNGRNLFKTSKYVSQDKQNFQISGLSKGVYLINIQGNNYNYSSKLICLNGQNGELKIDNISVVKIEKNQVTPKNITTTIDMNFASGNNLRFTGYSFNCFNIVIDVPTNNKTITFNFATTVPSINTTIASTITSNSASAGGNVTSNGSCNVTARGVCYSTNPNPTAADFIVASGNGTGQFTTNLTGLASGVKYYAKAYATNNAGTNYGNEINFTTLALPTITTNNITSITNTTANCGGIISSDGGDTVTARGVCWSTSQPSTIYDSKTINGTGTGSFSSGILGLTQNTTYYVRAYATNGVGTAYGNQVSFTSSQLLIGASYQGGVVAYIFQPGDPGYIVGETHGIIAATTDNPTNVIWGCSGTLLTGADGIALGDGNQNTIDIVYGCSTTGIAAKICSDLILNGYNDWYLPSIQELNKLYLNQALIGGFPPNLYWSSSEYDSNDAKTIDFGNGNPNNHNSKNAILNIRAIRSF